MKVDALASYVLTACRLEVSTLNYVIISSKTYLLDFDAAFNRRGFENQSTGLQAV